MTKEKVFELSVQLAGHMINHNTGIPVMSDCIRQCWKVIIKEMDQHDIELSAD